MYTLFLPFFKTRVMTIKPDKVYKKKFESDQKQSSIYPTVTVVVVVVLLDRTLRNIKCTIASTINNTIAMKPKT